MAINDPVTVIERYTHVTQESVEGEPVMSLRMAEFLEALTRQVNQNIPTSGTGSPETVVTAEPFKMYIDTAAAAGSNLYVKKTGSGNTGWTLV